MILVAFTFSCSNTRTAKHCCPPHTVISLTVDEGQSHTHAHTHTVTHAHTRTHTNTHTPSSPSTTVITPGEKHFASLSAFAPVTGFVKVISGSRRYDAVAEVVMTSHKYSVAILGTSCTTCSVSTHQRVRTWHDPGQFPSHKASSRPPPVRNTRTIIILLDVGLRRLSFPEVLVASFPGLTALRRLSTVKPGNEAKGGLGTRHFGQTCSFDVFFLNAILCECKCVLTLNGPFSSGGQK